MARLAFACAPAVAFAAVSGPALAVQHDEQFWLQVNTNVPLTHDVRVTLEQIVRFSDRQDGLYETELGALLGWKVAHDVELGFGYRWVGAFNGNAGANENRLRQQVVGSFGPMTTRLRLDERFNPNGSEIGFRLRPLVRYNHRIGANGTALFISHESFFLLNSTVWGQRAGYQRMRNIIGATLPIGRRVAADIGYLNQYRFASGTAAARMEHALSIQLTINLRGFEGVKIND